MKNPIIPLLFVIFLFLQVGDSLAATYCWTDQNNYYYVMSGGKLDVKPFSGYFSNGAGCHMSGHGVVMGGSSGVFHFSLNFAHTSNGSCSSFWMYGTLNPSLEGSGILDDNQDGSIQGTLQLSRVDCGTVPVSVR